MEVRAGLARGWAIAAGLLAALPHSACQATPATLSVNVTGPEAACVGPGGVLLGWKEFDDYRTAVLTADGQGVIFGFRTTEVPSSYEMERVDLHGRRVWLRSIECIPTGCDDDYCLSDRPKHLLARLDGGVAVGLGGAWAPGWKERMTPTYQPEGRWLMAMGPGGDVEWWLAESVPIACSMEGSMWDQEPVGALVSTRDGGTVVLGSHPAGPCKRRYEGRWTQPPCRSDFTPIWLPRVTRMDAGGRVVWERVYDPPGTDTEQGTVTERSVLAELVDGSILIGGCGMPLWLGRFSADGEIVTPPVYMMHGESTAVRAALATPDGGVVLAGGGSCGVGHEGSGSAWIMKLDASLSQEWVRPLDPDAWTYSAWRKTGIKCPSWKVAPCVEHDNGRADLARPGAMTALAATSDGGWLAAGYVHSGVLEFVPDESPWANCDNPVGHHEGKVLQSLRIVRLTAAGEIVWDRSYESLDDARDVLLIAESDEGTLLVVQRIDLYSAGARFVRLAPDGPYSPDCRL